MPNQAAAETADRASLTPVLRTVGNVAAGGGAAAVSQLLTQLSGNLLLAVRLLDTQCCSLIGWNTSVELNSTLRAAEPRCAGAAIPALLRCMQSPHRGLAKEAAWAVSNIAGSPGRSGVDALLAAGGAAIITNTLKEAAFDIRKEAAYAVANLCAGELTAVLCTQQHALCCGTTSAHQLLVGSDAAGGGGGTGDAAALTAMVGQDRKALEAMLDLMR